MTTALQITPASEWQQQTWISKLPSGKIVQLKKPSVFSLITDDGAIPDTAFEMFMESQGEEVDMTTKSPTEMREYLRTIMAMAKAIIPQAIVNLEVIVSGPVDYALGQIHIDDIDQQDQIFLVTWAMNGGEPELALARFLEQQQGAGLPIVQGMPSVLPASKPKDGDSESPDSV